MQREVQNLLGFRSKANAVELLKCPLVAALRFPNGLGAHFVLAAPPRNRSLHHMPQSFDVVKRTGHGLGKGRFLAFGPGCGTLHPRQ